MSKRFKDWYAKNSERLSSARKKRYAEDPAFRDHVNARNRENRLKAKADQPPRREHYDYDMRSVAENLDVTVSSLRWWMTAGYYPRPYMHDGKFWFTAHQIDLLRPIADLFAVDTAAKHSQELEVLKTTALMNWGN